MILDGGAPSSTRQFVPYIPPRPRQKHHPPPPILTTCPHPMQQCTPISFEPTAVLWNDTGHPILFHSPLHTLISGSLRFYLTGTPQPYPDSYKPTSPTPGPSRRTLLSLLCTPLRRLHSLKRATSLHCVDPHSFQVH